MGDDDRQTAYRIAHELLRDRLRREAPEALQDLEAIQAADVLVVKGQYDHIEHVFEKSGTPYTLVRPDQIEAAPLRSDQIVFVNCPGVIPGPGLRKLVGFVESGGFLFTTDWALRHVLEPAFPGFVEFNQQKTTDEVVRVEILEQEDPFLRSLLGPEDDPQWWLEASSYPIRVLNADKVKVLVISKEVGARYGEAPVFVTFDVGLGRIYHMISHFYLQRSETRTERHRMPSLAYFSEKKVTAQELEKYRQMGAEGLDTASVESAFTSQSMMTHVLHQKRLHNRRQSPPKETKPDDQDPAQ